MLKSLKAGIIISVAVEILREILELIFYGFMERYSSGRLIISSTSRLWRHCTQIICWVTI